MLNIYIGKENLPKDKKLIFDVDKAIMSVIISGTDFQRMVIENVEQGSYKDESMFIDRFGGALYYTNMSSGSKALLEVDYLKDFVVNCAECGENALAYLSYIDEGNVYLPRRDIALPWLVRKPVFCFGKEWKGIDHLNDLIG